MLIRSQDKEMIINMTVTNHIYVGEAYRPNGSLFDINADEMRLGYYSTKAKAMKVLDMIQEAYCEFMAVRNDDMWNGKESVFLMPEDSEVVV